MTQTSETLRTKTDNVMEKQNLNKSDYLFKLEKIQADLSKKLVAQYQQKNFNDENLQLWLNLRNVINMVHVCESFYRGALFYDDDDYHPIGNLLNQANLPYYYDLENIKNISYVNKNDELETPLDYTIKDKNISPAETLTKILFSKMNSECNSGISIAYYLTILDLLKLIHGKEAGMKQFDDFFKIKTDEIHHLNQMRFGMSFIAWPFLWYHYSPLYVFTALYPNYIVTFEDFKLNPWTYLGYRFYAQGHQDYIKIHPNGSYQGWNLIFYGLDNNKDPLFLGVRDMYKPYVFNYADMQMLLRTTYNHIPEAKGVEKTHQLCKPQDIVGWWSHSMIGFDLEKMKTMLFFPEKIKLEIKQQADYCYSRYILPNINFESNEVIEQQKKNNKIILNRIRKKTSFTKDDHHPSVLNFLKKNDIRPDYLKFNFFTRDDLAVEQEKKQKRTIETKEFERPVKLKKFTC